MRRFFIGLLLCLFSLQAFGLQKNVASQKIGVFAYDDTTGDAKTGDAAQITGRIALDWAPSPNATDDTNPTEYDATHFPGIYVFDLLQAETNADVVALYAKSSTSNIVLRPIIIHTTPADFPDEALATEAKQDIIDTNVDDIETDTGTTLPATLATIDTNVDDIETDTGTTLPATLSTIDGKIDTIDTNVDDIETDTGTTLPATLATIDTNVDDIETDTGTTLNALILDIPTVAEFEARSLAAADYFLYGTDPVELLDSGGSAGTSAAELVDDIFAEVLEGTIDFGDIMRLLGAYVAGDLGIVGTTYTYTGLDDVTTRIEGTSTASGRTVGTIDGD